MKEIKAIIQPFKLNDVISALSQIEGLPGVSVSDVRCLEPRHGTHCPDVNTKLELMVADHLVERVVQAIQQGAHTGKHGDGSIFIVDIESAIRIRSGERHS